MPRWIDLATPVAKLINKPRSNADIGFDQVSKLNERQRQTEIADQFPLSPRIAVAGERGTRATVELRPAPVTKESRQSDCALASNVPVATDWAGRQWVVAGRVNIIEVARQHVRERLVFVCDTGLRHIRPLMRGGQIPAKLDQPFVLSRRIEFEQRVTNEPHILHDSVTHTRTRTTSRLRRPARFS